MCELAIVFLKQYDYYIKTIQKCLHRAFKSKKIICTVMEEKDETKLLIACEKQHKQKLTSLLDDLISYFFLNYYKEDYLKLHLKLNNIDELRKAAFLKALICFDKEHDRIHIIKKLNYNNTLYLNSFFAFKCRVVKQKWQDICELTNDNMDFLGKPATFLELLKFLVKNLKTQQNSVLITYKNKKFNFFDENKKRIQFFLNSTKKDDIYFIQNLIELNPKTIELSYDNTIQVNTLEFIHELFQNKITLKETNHI